MGWQEKYIVFTKHIDAPWPEGDALIKFHRSEYDAGIVELLWWRQGDLLHWLRIPRKVRAKPRYYFRRWAEPSQVHRVQGPRGAK